MERNETRTGLTHFSISGAGQDAPPTVSSEASKDSSLRLCVKIGFTDRIPDCGDAPQLASYPRVPA